MTTIEPSARFILISGCSGGGKSALLSELGRRGYATVEEPGRRIVREELARGGSALPSALPWIDLQAFLHRVFALALGDFADAKAFAGPVFFDRGLIDAAAGLARAGGAPIAQTLGPSLRYHRRVFIAPPWPEIHVTDRERRHDFKSALTEYDHLLAVLPALDYELTLLPKLDVCARADFVLRTLGRAVNPSA